MGIKTLLTLDEANRLFKEYGFTQISPTSDGIIDTTYIVENASAGYILKKFEEADEGQVNEERQLLEKLAACRIPVPQHLSSAGGWHLYSRLPGKSPATAAYAHLQTLGRTLARMHRCTCTQKSNRRLFEQGLVLTQLKQLRQEHYKHYIALRRLRHYQPAEDGVVHGDLFTDNVLFAKQRIGIIDFIDAGTGSFAFDLGVTALAWALRPHTPGRVRLLLQSYNQHAPKKIARESLYREIEIAAAFYSLKRICGSRASLAHKKALLQQVSRQRRGQK